MKKNFLKFSCLFFLMFFLSSCYTYKFNVGEGPQTGAKVTGKNHYFINGLAPGSQTDYKELAGNSQDYEVTIKHTFIDGLLSALTGGIYSPTTVEVQK